MNEAPVLSETRNDGVVLITLNRPAARNAIDPALSAALQEDLRRLDRDEELRVAVLRGAGGDFCAGMDLHAFADATPEQAAETLDPLVREPPTKPVIAAVEGYALGGGLELALACDLIVAAADARLGLPEVKLALVPSGGGLLRLPRRIAPGVAAEMALTGAPRPAEELDRLGLFARLVPAGRAVAAALEIAAAIAANDPGAVAAAKALVRAGSRPAEELWEVQDRACRRLNAAPAARAAVAAFTASRRRGGDAR